MNGKPPVREIVAPSNSSEQSSEIGHEVLTDCYDKFLDTYNQAKENLLFLYHDLQDKGVHLSIRHPPQELNLFIKKPSPRSPAQSTSPPPVAHNTTTSPRATSRFHSFKSYSSFSQLSPFRSSSPPSSSSSSLQIQQYDEPETIKVTTTKALLTRLTTKNSICPRRYIHPEIADTTVSYLNTSDIKLQKGDELLKRGLREYMCRVITTEADTPNTKELLSALCGKRQYSESLRLASQINGKNIFIYFAIEQVEAIANIRKEKLAQRNNDRMNLTLLCFSDEHNLHHCLRCYDYQRAHLATNPLAVQLNYLQNSQQLHWMHLLNTGHIRYYLQTNTAHGQIQGVKAMKSILTWLPFD